MNESRTRIRLTIGYVGVFALTLLLLGLVAVFGFSRALVIQQDELLAQEARNTAKNLLEGSESEVLATESGEFGWIALDPEGDVIGRNWTTRPLGLPDRDLLRETLRKEETVSATVQGTDGAARVISMPMYDGSGALVGVMQYARALQVVRNTVNELILVLLPLGIGGLGLAAIGGAYLAGWARRPVQEAFERQRAFIADASHELKTPLTLIRADTEVLQRGLKDPGDRELAEDMLTEIDKMSRVLSDLLLTARLDAGKLPMDSGSFDLVPVIRQTADRFRRRAASRDLRLKIEASDGLPVRGDPARTGQILGVLLDNALAHTPQESTIVVSARARGGLVEAVVRDTGPGIPPEHLPHIFERFYRADKARSRASGGTGLGLSIARDLARAQKGDLEAENAGDGGSVFRLTLPSA
ncbi:MAG: HAMP domain-containing sensor histidine kinase [Actinomycetota bacterium]